MRVIAVATPEASSPFAQMTAMVAGENKVFKKKVYETKKGNYFIHRGKRVYFSLDSDGNSTLSCDVEPITMYVTMSDNYTATVTEDGISSMRYYLEHATWGENVDKNFGRITHLSGDSQRTSNTFKEAQKIILEFVQRFINEGKAKLEDFEGPSIRMKRQAKEYDGKPGVIARHKDLIWSIDQD